MPVLDVALLLSAPALGRCAQRLPETTVRAYAALVSVCRLRRCVTLKVSVLPETTVRHAGDVSATGTTVRYFATLVSECRLRRCVTYVDLALASPAVMPSLLQSTAVMPSLLR